MKIDFRIRFYNMVSDFVRYHGEREPWIHDAFVRKKQPKLLISMEEP
ncbi:hypothetical protein FOXYSP1_02782 [Fusarium oxysporum f. sp. phaseoli]